MATKKKPSKRKLSANKDTLKDLRVKGSGRVKAGAGRPYSCTYC